MEALVLKHGKMFEPGHVRTHYGAFSDPAVLSLQEKEMSCEALYHNTQDLERITTVLDDAERALR